MYVGYVYKSWRLGFSKVTKTKQRPETLCFHKNIGFSKLRQKVNLQLLKFVLKTYYYLRPSLASVLFHWCYPTDNCIKFSYIQTIFGRAMAQVVSRWPLTAGARFRARVNPCGICGGHSGTGTGFSPSSSIFSCQYIIPPSLSKFISVECVICIQAWVLDPPHFQERKNKQTTTGLYHLLKCIIWGFVKRVSIYGRTNNAVKYLIWLEICSVH
jgi:hypothetical protein